MRFLKSFSKPFMTDNTKISAKTPTATDKSEIVRIKETNGGLRRVER
jgi:hypothetical protein